MRNSACFGPIMKNPNASAATHVVASALDRSGLPDVLGTVAGYDTLVVIVAEGTSGAAMAEVLAELAGLR